jgi:hypothetical protein
MTHPRRSAEEHFAELARDIDATPAPVRKAAPAKPMPASVKPILETVSKGIAEAIHEATKATQNAEILAKLDEVAACQKELANGIYLLIEIMRAPKRLVKDRQGKTIGSEVVLQDQAPAKDAAE